MLIDIKNARLAFPNLFEAKTNDDGSAKFGASFIIPPGHPQMAAINAAIEKVATEKWKDKAPAILKQLKATDKLALHDGDTKAQYDGFAGNFYISANNGSRPTIVDRNGSPLVAADGKPYAGCYVLVKLELWAQDNKFGKRVNATLRGVQFMADGDSFAAGAPPAKPEEFAPLDDGAELAGDLV